MTDRLTLDEIRDYKGDAEHNIEQAVNGIISKLRVKTGLRVVDIQMEINPTSPVTTYRFRIKMEEI